MTRETAPTTLQNHNHINIIREVTWDYVSHVPHTMNEQISFKLLRYVRYLADTGHERVELEIKVRTPLGRAVLQIPASHFRGNQALDTVIDRTGYVFRDLHAAREKLLKVTRRRAPEVSMTSVSGWKGTSGMRAFVTAWAVHGHDHAVGQYEYLENPMSPSGEKGLSGDADGWRGTVGAGMLKSSAGVTLVGAALAAPLIRFTDIREMFTIVLAAESSTGKSTIQDGAFSVQGHPTELSADSTRRAILERGAAFNEMLFVVADLALLPVKTAWSLINHLAYGVTASASKMTSRVNARTLPTLNYQTIAMCTSEKTSTEIASLAGAERQGGESVRLFELTCQPNPGFFDRLAEGDEAAEVAEGILRASKEHYGVILRDWVNFLTNQDGTWIRARLDLHTTRFMRAVAGAGRQKDRERRAARKFGLLYGALLIARYAGVLDWSRADIRAAIMRSFEIAMRNAPTETSVEAIADLRRALLEPGAIVSEEDANDDPNWLGVRTNCNRRSVIGLSETAVNDAIGRFRAKLAFAALEQSGQLTIGRGQLRWQKRIGAKRHRLLQLSPEVIDH